MPLATSPPLHHRFPYWAECVIQGDSPYSGWGAGLADCREVILCPCRARLPHTQQQQHYTDIGTPDVPASRRLHSAPGARPRLLLAHCCTRHCETSTSHGPPVPSQSKRRPRSVYMARRPCSTIIESVCRGNLVLGLRARQALPPCTPTMLMVHQRQHHRSWPSRSSYPGSQNRLSS